MVSLLLRSGIRNILRLTPWLDEVWGVIAKSGVHLGDDSWALHVALMMERPTIPWWRDYEGRDEWQPQGKDHRALIGRESPDGLTGISAPGILNRLY